MTNENAFAESWINVEHEILGKKLRALSLFHLIWLHNIESPLVITSKEVTLSDLEIGVVICSSATNEEVLSGLNSKEIKGWRGIFDKETQCRKANKKKSLAVELKKFLAYYDDYLALPRMNIKPGESDNPIPLFLLHAAALIKHTGWTEKEVFLMPIGKVIWFNLSLGYLETGESSIQSDKELAAIEAIMNLTRQSNATLTANKD